MVWDHWFWVDPEDGIGIVNFDALLSALKKGRSLQILVDELFEYEWLPLEGRDFRVSYAATAVNGVVLESATFYP